MTTDKTGATVTVHQLPDRFAIDADDRTAGFTLYLDRDQQRIFYHTEVDSEFGGRGLATILVAEALRQTRADGQRIVPICPLVAGYLTKHHDFDDIVDKVTPDLLTYTQQHRPR